jgi:prolyl-tRNA synthetase
MRGREFSMKDMYSFHPSEDSLNEYYKIVQKAYFKIFERLGLIDLTYLTYASGGAFSKYSHEFQTLSEAGEDLIHICQKCKIAINQEILEESNGCPHCGNTELEAQKAIEVANIFKLGTRFSGPFNFKFRDAEGSEQPVIMGCYGIGPSRVMGTIVEVSHDERGVIWPEAIAPFKVHLIGLNQEKEADKLYEALLAAGVEVLYNDVEAGIGEKMAEADLFGCPYRVLVSPKSLAAGGAEIKRRNSNEVVIVDLKKVVDYLK